MLSPEAQIAYFRNNNDLDARTSSSLTSRSRETSPDPKRPHLSQAPQIILPKSGSPQRPSLGRRAHSAPLVQWALRNDTAKNQLKLSERSACPNVPSGHASIAEDAFFKRYIDPETQQPKQLFEVVLEEKTGDEAVDTFAKEASDTLAGLPQSIVHRAGKRWIEANIIVIGVGGVAIPDFVNAALTPIDECLGPGSKAFTVNGVQYAVRLLQFSFEDIVIREDGFVSWPQAPNQVLPHIHGVIVAYDAQNSESLRLIPRLRNALSKANIKSIVVFQTSEALQTSSAVDGIYEGAFKLLGNEVQILHTSPSIPGSEQRCVEVLLHAVAFGASGATYRPVLPRHASVPVSRVMHDWSGRDVQGPTAPQIVISKHAASQLDSFNFSAQTASESPLMHPPTHPTITRQPSTQRQPPNLIIPESSEDRSTFSSVDTDVALRRESDTSEDTNNSEPVALLGKAPELDQLALTFDELVDRFLTPPETKNDIKFTAIFLAFYRMFAAPFQLLEGIMYRFNYMFESQLDREANHTFLVRCLLLLDRWIGAYPGDFAHEVTMMRLKRFLAHVMQDRTYVTAATQISVALEAVMNDDDTDWAYADAQFAWRGSLAAAPFANGEPFAALSLEATTSTTIASEPDSKLTFGVQSSFIPAIVVLPRPRRDTASSSQQSVPKSLIENAQRQAAHLNPNPVQPFTKNQWHNFMAISEDVIARELTRIDWIMFTSIKPRDLIRHVTISSSTRSRFPRLANVTRMISHFNHIALWISNIVLLRDKAKHRAQALEKCMRLARKLRELNNYNSLGAVVAGIQGSAVHRLRATRELVSPAVRKDFLRLEMLMGTQKGSFAYRLAWENSERERIPYLPLHRGDLAVVEAGRDTFAGGHRRPSAASNGLWPVPSPRTPMSALSHVSAQSAPSFAPKINWRKFEAMGDVIVGVQRAQQTPYTGLVANEEVRALVLDGMVVTDEDELYQWSQSREPSGSFSASDGGGSASAGGTTGGRSLKRSFDRWLMRSSVALS